MNHGAPADESLTGQLRPLVSSNLQHFLQIPQGTEQFADEVYQLVNLLGTADDAERRVILERLAAIEQVVSQVRQHPLTSR